MSRTLRAVFSLAAGVPPPIARMPYTQTANDNTRHAHHETIVHCCVVLFLLLEFHRLVSFKQYHDYRRHRGTSVYYCHFGDRRDA